MTALLSRLPSITDSAPDRVRAQQLLDEMKHGDLHLVQIVATPLCTLLEKARRAIWRERGEADRPPPAPLGAHDERRATGEPSHHTYNAARDGDYQEWRRREDAKAALAAEAQLAWEEKAGAEAEAWAKREADKPQSSPGFPGEGDHLQDGGGASGDEARDPEAGP